MGDVARKISRRQIIAMLPGESIYQDHRKRGDREILPRAGAGMALIPAMAGVSVTEQDSYRVFP